MLRLGSNDKCTAIPISTHRIHDFTAQAYLSAIDDVDGKDGAASTTGFLPIVDEMLTVVGPAKQIVRQITCNTPHVGTVGIHHIDITSTGYSNIGAESRVYTNCNRLTIW